MIDAADAFEEDCDMEALPDAVSDSLRIEALEDDLRILRSDHEALSRRLEGLEMLVSELDDRLGIDLERRARQRADLNDDAVLHTNIASSYLAFVEQKLFRVAQRHHGQMRRGRKAPAAEQIALLMSDLTLGLFKEDSIDEAAIICLVQTEDHRWFEDVKRLILLASGFVNQIHNAGLAKPWDFSLGRRNIVDSPRQKVWGACDPTKRIKFVVAPGYVANGTQYCSQFVFTGE